MTGVEAAELGLVNHAVPADEGLDVAMAFAERISHVPLEMLYSHKEATNRWWPRVKVFKSIIEALEERLEELGVDVAQAVPSAEYPEPLEPVQVEGSREDLEDQVEGGDRDARND